MKERLKYLAPKVGFPIFYLFCLLVFCSWTFPYDKLKERIVLAFNQQQIDTGGQQQLKIESLGSSWVTGVDARGVKLVSPSAEPGKPPTEMLLDRVRARVSLLPLMFGSHDVSFKIDAFGGTIKGEYDESSKEKSIEIAFDEIDLGQIGMVTGALGVPVEGKLTGEVNLAMAEGKAAKAQGTVTLDVADVAVGDGKAKLKGFLALPRVNVGAVSFVAEAKEGLIKVSKLAAGGKDVELQGDGRIQLRDVFGESLGDMNVRFKINDAYRNKNDTTQSLFGKPGSTMPALFEMDPKVKQSKRADGFYSWHMRGPLSKPEFDPAPFAGGPIAPPGGGPAMPGAKVPQ